MVGTSNQSVPGMAIDKIDMMTMGHPMTAAAAAKAQDQQTIQADWKKAHLPQPSTTSPPVSVKYCDTNTWVPSGKLV